MSNRLPEPNKESATTKQRPVRNLCAYHHSSSSSSSSIKTMQNLGIDLQNHVQKTQFSEEDTLVLSGTERSVTLKHEQPEDPTSPQDEANQGLKQKIFRISVENLTCPLHTFPVNQALWRTFMNSCMWHQYTSVEMMRSSNAPEIKTIFGTLQAQISNLKCRDQEIHGLEEAVDWTSGQDQRMTAQFTTKVCMGSSIRFLVLAENVKNILMHPMLGKPIASENSSKVQNMNRITISQVLCGRFTWKDDH